jgi:hypothetical protein
VVAELSPEVLFLVFAVAELSLEILVLVVEPEVVSVAAEPSSEVLVLVVEPEIVSVAAEPQASVDIAVAFDFLVPVSVVVVEVYSSEHPKFLAFPNVDYFASSSNSVEVVG